MFLVHFFDSRRQHSVGPSLLPDQIPCALRSIGQVLCKIVFKAAAYTGLQPPWPASLRKDYASLTILSVVADLFLCRFDINSLSLD